MSIKFSDLKVKLFTDGADKAQILDMAKQPWIKGFTTNPSLLKKAGVKDYAAYGRDLVAAVPDRHISFEVFSDDIPEMIAQARRHRHLGRQCLRQAAGDDDPRRAAVRRGALAVARRRQDQHDGDLHQRPGRARGRCARRRRARLRVGVRRPSGRSRHRLSSDHAGRGRARPQDRECRDHLGLDPRSLQRRRSRRDGLPHHHGAGGYPQEAARARNAERRRAVARRGQGVPRRRACGRPEPRGGRCRVPTGACGRAPDRGSGVRRGARCQARLL